jgi:hypothetical protein
MIFSPKSRRYFNLSDSHCNGRYCGNKRKQPPGCNFSYLLMGNSSSARFGKNPKYSGNANLLGKFG